MANMNTNKGGGFGSNLSYLLIGGGIGAALALLFAPKPGAELRGDISDMAHRGYDSTLDMAQRVMDQSRDLYGNLKNKADQMTGGAASRLEDKVLNAASDMVSDARGGVSTGEDLLNGGGQLLDGLDQGGRDKGSAKGTNTGF
ncbi:MAG: YtxH domain-containing protein [Acidobacteria bacterium]|nr:YtxH domain-containing protein [Acidobacteriota bacterium]